MSDELIALQTTVAFQEHALSGLNDVITDQQKQLDRLRQELRLLQERFADLEGMVDSGAPGAAPEDEVPPHY